MSIEEYVVLHISFVTFVITGFNNAYSLELKRFDSRSDSNSNLNAGFNSRFDLNANGRFAGP